MELKLASGMTNPARLNDLADVMELIKLLRLTAEFGEQLHPFVRDKYEELRRNAEPQGEEDQPASWGVDKDDSSTDE